MRAGAKTGTPPASTAAHPCPETRADRRLGDRRPCAKSEDPQRAALATARSGAGASWCRLPRRARSTAVPGLCDPGCLPTEVRAPLQDEARHTPVQRATWRPAGRASCAWPRSTTARALGPPHDAGASPSLRGELDSQGSGRTRTPAPGSCRADPALGERQPDRRRPPDDPPATDRRFQDRSLAG